MFNNKNILITGGTTFGHMFVEKIIENYKPRKLIIYSRDELKQSEMQKKFDHSFMSFFLVTSEIKKVKSSDVRC